MPRHAVPAEVRQRRGDPKRKTPVVVGGRRKPSMPPSMEPDMVACWRTIVDDLSRADAIDHADAGVIEAAAVMWGRARQARSAMMEDGQDLLIRTPQGVVPNRLLTMEREAWREFRALAESLPLSPWGRARLGLRSNGPRADIADDIGRPPRLSVVNGPDEDGP